MAVRDFQAELCWRLARIATGTSAQALAAGGHCKGVAVLPAWVWLPPRVDMGRKGLYGSAPVRVVYSQDGVQVGPAVAVTGATASNLSWEAIGAGWSMSGELRLVPVYGPDPDRPLPLRLPTEVPKEVPVPIVSKERLAESLAKLEADASLARWELLGEVTVILKRYIQSARSAVLISVEHGEIAPPWQSVHDGSASAFLSQTDVEALADDLVFGPLWQDKASRGPSRVDRLIDRCLRPSTFQRVDPLRYVTTDLRCAVRQSVRRYIGDPDAGREIRRIANILYIPRNRPPTDEEISTVIKAYRALHPSDQLGPLRTVNALRLRTMSAPPASQRHYNDTSETAVGAVSVSDIINAVVARCRSEGGANLAEVAERWLSAEASGTTVSVEDIANEMWLPAAHVKHLIARAHSLAVSELEDDGAARKKIAS